MKHFLILFEEMPVDNASVKSGDNSPEVITAVRCVNVGLFLSGDLRRDVVVSFAIGPLDEMIVISFPGVDLKRVSPDERSISFFLLKAIAVAEKLEMNSLRTMDNGIAIRRTNMLDFIETYSPERIYEANSEVEQVVMKKFDYVNSLLIYSNTKQPALELKGSKWNLKQLHRPPHPERFILDVNMVSDDDVI